MLKSKQSRNKLAGTAKSVSSPDARRSSASSVFKVNFCNAVALDTPSQVVPDGSAEPNKRTAEERRDVAEGDTRHVQLVDVQPTGGDQPTLDAVPASNLNAMDVEMDAPGLQEDLANVSLETAVVALVEAPDTSAQANAPLSCDDSNRADAFDQVLNTKNEQLEAGPSDVVSGTHAMDTGIPADSVDQCHSPRTSDEQDMVSGYPPPPDGDAIMQSSPLLQVPTCSMTAVDFSVGQPPSAGMILEQQLDQTSIVDHAPAADTRQIKIEDVGPPLAANMPENRVDSTGDQQCDGPSLPVLQEPILAHPTGNIPALHEVSTTSEFAPLFAPYLDGTNNTAVPLLCERMDRASIAEDEDDAEDEEKRRLLEESTDLNGAMMTKTLPPCDPPTNLFTASEVPVVDEETQVADDRSPTLTNVRSSWTKSTMSGTSGREDGMSGEVIALDGGGGQVEPKPESVDRSSTLTSVRSSCTKSTMSGTSGKEEGMSSEVIAGATGGVVAQVEAEEPEPAPEPEPEPEPASDLQPAPPIPIVNGLKTEEEVAEPDLSDGVAKTTEAGALASRVKRIHLDVVYHRTKNEVYCRRCLRQDPPRVVEYPSGTADGVLVGHWVGEHGDEPLFGVLMGMSDREMEEISRQLNSDAETNQ